MDTDIKRAVSDAMWKQLAARLQVELAALKAIAEVESSGSGFLPAPDRRPKILFEGHVFHRLTAGRHSATHPNISYPKWDRRQYSGSLAGEWKRLDKAAALDPDAAMQSASWGAFQIMGFNYALCGSDTVGRFVECQGRRCRRPAGILRQPALPPRLAADPAAAAQGLGEVRQPVQRPGLPPEPLRRKDGGRLRAPCGTCTRAWRTPHCGRACPLGSRARRTGTTGTGAAGDAGADRRRHRAQAHQPRFQRASRRGRPARLGVPAQCRLGAGRRALSARRAADARPGA